MAKLLMTNSGRGQELCDLLRTELGVPERTCSMSVTFTAGEPVVVACEFFPSNNCRSRTTMTRSDRTTTEV